jgi:uncharacterized protein
MLALLPLLMRSGRRGWIIGLILLAVIVAGGGLATRESSPLAGTTAAKTGDEKVQFVSFVLDDIQNTWQREFAARGQSYERSKLVLFTDATGTACGFGQAASGPFYCPSDSRVYVDLSFYDELERRLGAAGDFAQAYVIAHEIGHHVQHLRGTSDRVGNVRPSARRGESGVSVRLELQADCLAGVWAHSTSQRDLLERGDLEEALGAAAAIGDDRLQRQAQGRVHPETWTHGSSEQRARWFRRGFESGSSDRCDTFTEDVL